MPAEAERMVPGAGALLIQAALFQVFNVVKVPLKKKYSFGI